MGGWVGIVPESEKTPTGLPIGRCSERPPVLLALVQFLASGIFSSVGINFSCGSSHSGCLVESCGEVM